MHRSTDGDSASACLATTPRGGRDLHCCGPLFSCQHTQNPQQVVFALLFSSSPPVVTLLSFICRVHPSRQWRHYLSGVKARGKVTVVAVGAFLKTPTKPFSCVFVRHSKVCRWTMMSRRGIQVQRGRGFPLKATPVFVVGVVVLVIILFVYLEMILMFPW